MSETNISMGRHICMCMCTLLEFGADEYALFQGRVAEFRMTERMVTLGRSTPSCPVTFDLSLEGPAYKISRRQVSTERNAEALTLMAV